MYHCYENALGGGVKRCLQCVLSQHLVPAVSSIVGSIGWVNDKIQK